MEPISAGFEELAAAFYGGEEIYGMEYYESKANSHKPSANDGVENAVTATSIDGICYSLLNNDVVDLDANVNRLYEITAEGGDWAKVLSIVEDEDLMNDKPFELLLRDLFLNTDIENAARKHSLYQGFKVFPQAELINNMAKQLDQIQELEKTGSTRFKIVTVEISENLATGNPANSEEGGADLAPPLSTSRVSHPSNIDDLANKKPAPSNTMASKRGAKKNSKNGKNSKKHKMKPKPISTLSSEETAVDLDDLKDGRAVPSPDVCPRADNRSLKGVCGNVR